MADMYVDLETSRSISWAAAQEGADAEIVTAAKVHCSEAFQRIASEMVQLHGGITITWEHDAHLFFKRTRALANLFPLKMRVTTWARACVEGLPDVAGLRTLGTRGLASHERGPFHLCHALAAQGCSSCQTADVLPLLTRLPNRRTRQVLRSVRVPSRRLVIPVLLITLATACSEPLSESEQKAKEVLDTAASYEGTLYTLEGLSTLPGSYVPLAIPATNPEARAFGVSGTTDDGYDVTLFQSDADESLSEDSNMVPHTSDSLCPIAYTPDDGDVVTCEAVPGHSAHVRTTRSSDGTAFLFIATDPPGGGVSLTIRVPVSPGQPDIEDPAAWTADLLDHLVPYDPSKVTVEEYATIIRPT